MGTLTAARGGRRAGRQGARADRGTARKSTARRGAAGRPGPAAALRRRAAAKVLIAFVVVLGAGLATWQAVARPAPAHTAVPASSAKPPRPAGPLQRAQLAQLPPALAGLVLTPAAAGPSYTLNARVSGPRSLNVVSAGDTPAVTAIIKRDWLRGAEAAFDGRGGGPGLVSIGDVFRPGTPVNAILAAWRTDALRTLSGTVMRLPAGVPGTRPVLINGTFAGYGVLLYLWRTGNTIASVELVGSPQALRAPLLIQLAARQQAALRKSAR